MSRIYVGHAWNLSREGFKFQERLKPLSRLESLSGMSSVFFENRYFLLTIPSRNVCNFHHECLKSASGIDLFQILSQIPGRNAPQIALTNTI